MISIIDKEKCCGCNACGDICNQHAITFHLDREGFWYPRVDPNLCTNLVCANVPVHNWLNTIKNTTIYKLHEFLLHTAKMKILEWIVHRGGYIQCWL